MKHLECTSVAMSFVFETSTNFIFFQYGEIENLLVSSKKKGSAIIEFKNFKSAVSVACKCQNVTQ
jgi:hypothetical protein